MNLTRKLLLRGDHLSIENGQLKIKPMSKRVVPKEWLKINRETIIREILIALNINNAMQYIGYKTGKYGNTKASGITLQFLNVISNESLYSIFNVQLEYLRNGEKHKKGDPLPEGHFRVGKRAYFYDFWFMTKLKQPRHFSSIHDYMGKLSTVVFLYNANEKTKKNKVKYKSISVLSVNYPTLLDVFEKSIIPAMPQRIYGEEPQKNRIKHSEKDIRDNQSEYLIAKNGSTRVNK